MVASGDTVHEAAMSGTGTRVSSKETSPFNNKSGVERRGIFFQADVKIVRDVVIHFSRATEKKETAKKEYRKQIILFEHHHFVGVFCLSSLYVDITFL